MVSIKVGVRHTVHDKTKILCFFISEVLKRASFMAEYPYGGRGGQYQNIKFMRYRFLA